MAQDSDWDDIFGAPDEEPPSAPKPVRHGLDMSGSGVVEPAPLSRRALREQEKNAGTAPKRSTYQEASGYQEGSGPPDDPGEPAEPREPRAPRPPRRKRRFIWVWVLLGVLAVGAGSAVWAWANYEEQIRAVMGWEIPPEDYVGDGLEETTVAIVDGDNGEDIANTLFEAGVVKSFDVFYDLLLAQDPPVQFFPGNYLLATQMSAQSALDALQDPERRLQQTALIQEGKSLDQVFDILSAATEIPVADFKAAAEDPAAFGVPSEAPSLEGYLFPAKYTFDAGLDATTVIQTLVNRTFQSLDAAGVAAEDRHRVLTIAALVQREAGANPEDFYKVSRVIQNRLDANMMLQFDSTSHYGYAFKHGKRLESSVFSTTEELNDDNPYNTYVHTGLPIGPIGAPGDLAIESALHPADGTWLYFVTVNLETGETVFSNTNAEHNVAVAKMQEWCRTTQSDTCD